MQRRDFLTQGLGLGLGLGLSSTWSALVQRAFGDEGAGSRAGPPERAAELALAIARARRDGKPLLLLVVPTDASLVYPRGRVLGELINHGGPGVTDDLLVCELACATIAEAARVLPLDVKTDPAMLLVELEAEGGEFLPATPIDLPPGPRGVKGTPEEEPAIRARIAAGASALHAAVARDSGVAPRAARSRAALSEADRTALDEGLAGRVAIDTALARRGAALLVVAATDGAPEPRTRARAALDAAAAELVKARPPGARWARAEGCGTSIEGEPPVGVECGMGSVPVLSQRFLYFYTHR